MSTDRPTFEAANGPAPLPKRHLDAIPGVLGSIARERAEDYASVPQPEGASGAPQAQRFSGALIQPGLTFICEVKRSSPSQGDIRDLDPVTTAAAYRRGGAGALSVLTEPRHFGGSLGDLASVTTHVALPAMRKEFVVHPAQMAEAAEAGAAAVLLMVSVLGAHTEAYLKYAHACGLEALVEVHDEEELHVALAAGASIVGVNNRDLATLQVDRSTAPRLMAKARESGHRGLLVAESGYAHASDLQPLKGLADAVLVGTALAQSGEPERALVELRSGAEETPA